MKRRKSAGLSGPPNPRGIRLRSGYSSGRRRQRLARRLLSVAAVIMAVFAVAASDKLHVRDFDGLLADTTSGPYDIEGRAEVTDGDTLNINGQRIRLHGIDAPESAQSCTTASGGSYSCGRDSTRALEEKTKGRYVSCERRDVDRYGRMVAVCYAKGENLNHWMVSEGWAVAYTRYSWAYVPAETKARLTGRGIWAGEFTTPEDWRRSNR
jgi:endonuclease YncB( thermonuclease family)